MKNNGVIKVSTNAITYDGVLSNFIAGYFFVAALNLFVKIYLGEFAWWSFVSKAILAILLIGALIPISKRNIKLFVSTELIIFVLLIMSRYFGDVDLSYFERNYFYLLCVYVPLGISAYCIIDYYILTRKLYFIAIPSLLLLSIVILSKNAEEGTYIMSAGYYLLLDLLLFIDDFINNKKKIDLLFIFVSITVIILGASRGPIICLFGYLLIKIFGSNVSRGLKTTIVLFIMTVLLFWRQLASSLYTILSNNGYNSRTLNLLLSSEISVDSGRESLYLHYIDLIKNKYVFWGAGITGGWESEGLYPHNIVIEFCLSFGLIIGIALFMVILVIIIRGIRGKNNLTLNNLCEVFVSYMAALLISDSFVEAVQFYIGIALCLKSINMRERDLYEEKSNI